MDVTRPDQTRQALPGNELTGLFQKDFQDAERLFLQADSSALFVELSASGVQLEKAESDQAGRHGLLGRIIGRATYSYKHRYSNELARHIQTSTGPLTATKIYAIV